MTEDKKPTCIFCNKVWSDDMVKILDIYASPGCDSCGYGSKTTGTIDITCDGCDKTIYRKEFSA